MAERKLVPISRVDSDRLTTDIRWPDFIPMERIFVDTDRLYKICDLAHIGGLHIVGSITKEPIPMAFQLERDAAGGSIRLDTHKAILNWDELNIAQFNRGRGMRKLVAQVGETYAAVYFDLATMQEDIQHDKRWRLKYPPQAWAYYLDMSLRSNLSEVVNQQLLRDLKDFRLRSFWERMIPVFPIPYLPYLLSFQTIIETE